MADRPGTQVDVHIVGRELYTFTKEYRKPVGYILKWKFASGTELKPDLEVWDPENPTQKIKIIGVLDGDIYWKGGKTDPIHLSGRLSSPNKAKLSKAVNSTDGGADQELSWVVINYDPEAKEYFKCFHTEGEVKLVFTPGQPCQVNAVDNTDVTEPPNYSFKCVFTAKGSAGVQQLHCAEDAGEKSVKELGGVGAAG